MSEQHKRIVAVDFDGVLHAYAGDWEGLEVVNQRPVRGAIGWLKVMLADGRFDVRIFSVRNGDPGGVEAMRGWLLDNGLKAEEVAAIGFPEHKPGASLFIDDRAFCFRGMFPTPDEIAAFKPWWKVSG